MSKKSNVAVTAPATDLHLSCRLIERVCECRVSAKEIEHLFVGIVYQKIKEHIEDYVQLATTPTGKSMATSSNGNSKSTTAASKKPPQSSKNKGHFAPSAGSLLGIQLKVSTSITIPCEIRSAAFSADNATWGWAVLETWREVLAELSPTSGPLPVIVRADGTLFHLKVV